MAGQAQAVDGALQALSDSTRRRARQTSHPPQEVAARHEARNHEQAGAVDAERAEHQDSDERTRGDADGARGDVDGHAEAAPPCLQQATNIQRSERMKRPRSNP